MRLQISKFLIVSLLTLIVLSPELVVLSVVWEQHMQLVEIQHRSCKVEETQAGVFSIIGNRNQVSAQNFAQDAATIKFLDANFLHILLTPTQLYKVVDHLKWFFYYFL